MQDYIYTVPTEALQYVEFQFDRFKAPKPSTRSLDKVIDFTLSTIVRLKYFPTLEQDALARYERPGLTEMEKHQILGKLEYELRIFLRITEAEITFNQLHLATWATIMFAWSSYGTGVVDWYKKIGNKEDVNAQTEIQDRDKRIS